MLVLSRLGCNRLLSCMTTETATSTATTPLSSSCFLSIFHSLSSSSYSFSPFPSSSTTNGYPRPSFLSTSPSSPSRLFYSSWIPTNHNITSGHIDLIMGPMFSGKTTEMFRRVNRYQIAGRRCLVIKYKKDTRYHDTMASTHDRQMITALPCSKLREAREAAKDYDVVGIDDGHFFSDLAEMSEELANAGKTVVVAALDGTFQRKGFVPVLELLALSEHVTKLSAVCVECSADAAFTNRTGQEQEVELIGGAEKYIALCRSCYHQLQKSKCDTSH